MSNYMEDNIAEMSDEIIREIDMTRNNLFILTENNDSVNKDSLMDESIERLGAIIKEIRYLANYCMQRAE